MDLIPYDGRLPATLQQTETGTVSSVFITLLSEDEQRLDLLNKIRSWFSNRPEVSIVAHGTTDKQGYACIMLEWNGYEIDPLFIAILEEENTIEDYTVFGREG